MKVIIAGGRDYHLTESDYIKLNMLDITEVVSGGAKGVDASGEHWADIHNISVKAFKADWKQYGRAAGPIRNKKMAIYADAVVLFPGGKGTESMHNLAVQQGIRVFDFRQQKANLLRKKFC
ncbi:DUF2493 domain-containing protein [sulfur-oxidizing endosymbiont of Gigantopelta aegis]|uniref:DUF2493 domain-containing protein n=1 Tax=sulfur-oxidizing endosymbiont of Gigantopelta aegis TaxID=2794934 RepID=UPI0018DC745E|nr:DUF2493 domain-containing protein [sulfur-oxidizing endosymbiont of Gigantopelta aegis]